MDACYCDYESPAVYCAELRKARKPHRCLECGNKITIGERYEHVFAVWDGSAQACRTCQRCLSLRDFVLAHVPCSCWTHGNMIEEIMQDADSYAHEAPGLLFGAYRRKILIDRAKAKP